MTAQDDDLSGNTTAGITNNQTNPAYAVTATDDWWGSLHGPTTTANPGGNGTSVSSNVSFTPWIGVYTTGAGPGFQPTGITLYAVPTQLVFVTEPSSTAGTAFSFTVTAYDVNNTVAAGYAGTIQFTSSDSAAILPANYTFTTADAGTHTFSATLKTSGLQTITATDTVSASITGKGSTTVSTGGTTASASFLEQDAKTQGSWVGTYGAQGYDIVSGPSSLPSGDTVTPSGQSTYTWTTTSSDPRALQVPGSSNRVAAVWYSATSFTVNVNLADGQTHDLELYFLDWDNKGRSEQVQISTASGTVLDTETISAFSNGVYLDWKVSGNLVIKISEKAGANAVLNGLFIDPTSSPTPTATASFLEQDTKTQGSWMGTYGAQGYDIVSGPSSLPSGDTVTPSGQSTYTWTTTSSDPRALQVPGSSNRVAAVWYSATSFTVNVNLTDGQVHDLELYFLDWDNRGRSEQVQITSAATGAVLSTQTVSSFQSGTYLDYAISGNVLITFTKLSGPNAVLSGLFLDSPPGPSATFLKQDTTTQGTWIHTYGARATTSSAAAAPIASPPTPPSPPRASQPTPGPPAPPIPAPSRSPAAPAASPPPGIPPPASPWTSTSPTARCTTWSSTSSTGTTGAGASRCRSPARRPAPCSPPRRSRRSSRGPTSTTPSAATS